MDELKYKVIYKTRCILISKELLIKQQCEENLDCIKKLHRDRLELEDYMGNCNNEARMSVLYKDWSRIQFELQRQWKFKEDSKYHIFWKIPSCKCPILDNNDMYPYGGYLFSSDCPVHKHLLKKK